MTADQIRNALIALFVGIAALIGVFLVTMNGTPTPVPSPSPSVTVSPSPSGTPSPIPSASPKPSPSPSTVASLCTLGPNASLKGYDVFPPTNPWRTDISAAPVDALSAIYLAAISTKPLRMEFGSALYNGGPLGIPYIVVNNATPMTQLAISYPQESDPGPYPFPPNTPVEWGSDKHAIAINCEGNRLYEIYKMSGGSGEIIWPVGSAAKFDLTKTAGQQRPLGWTSADAAGLPIFPGLVRADEVFERKEINHALRFTVVQTQSGYVSPATHSASYNFTATMLPMGARLRLKASVNISGYSPANQVILKALKKYGMFLADNGGDLFVQGAPDARWDDNDLRALMAVTAANFEVVQTGAITKVGNWP